MTDKRLSAPHTAAGRLQRALLRQLRVHEREGTLPTSHRFLFYELVGLGIVSKERPPRTDGKKGRRTDQNLIDALTHLRQEGIVKWDWIVDETRSLTTWRVAPSVAEYVADAADSASLDRWDGEPAPLILCESRSLAGTLHSLAAVYACPITSTNGQCRGFLITKVAPALERGQRVLYLGDWDRCGMQIEANARRTLVEHSEDWEDYDEDGEELWERVALTAAQVQQHSLPVIQKRDGRYRGVRYFDAVETEALGQARIRDILRDRLDELMPEPLNSVLERQRRQRERVAEQLRQMSDDDE